MELIVEVEGGEAASLPGGGADLVAFMSFCVMRGFGAQHPLLALAERAEAMGVAMGPLTLFYAADVEDSEDREKAGLAWQEAGPLAAAVGGLLGMLAVDEPAVAFVRRAAAGGLGDDLLLLQAIARRAESEGVRLRLLYRD